MRCTEGRDDFQASVTQRRRQAFAAEQQNASVAAPLEIVRGARRGGHDGIVRKAKADVAQPFEILPRGMRGAVGEQNEGYTTLRQSARERERAGQRGLAVITVIAENQRAVEVEYEGA